LCANSHEAGLADMGKDLTQFLDTLPDQLGRDVQLAPVQVVAIINAIERGRGCMSA